MPNPVRGSPRDAGVSAVMGALLLVAVTGTLAAATFLWMNGFRSDDRDITRASMGVRAVDLPERWNDPDATPEVDADRDPDAIELALTNSPRDIAASDVAISLDGQLLTWNAASMMYFVGGDSTPGETCATDPGGNGNDIWEPGAAVLIVASAAAVAPSSLCDGQASLASDFRSLAGLRSVKVSIRGQVVLDTTLRVLDDAAT